MSVGRVSGVKRLPITSYEKPEGGNYGPLFIPFVRLFVITGDSRVRQVVYGTLGPDKGPGFRETK